MTDEIEAFPTRLSDNVSDICLRTQWHKSLLEMLNVISWFRLAQIKRPLAETSGLI